MNKTRVNRATFGVPTPGLPHIAPSRTRSGKWTVRTFTSIYGRDTFTEAVAVARALRPYRQKDADHA